MEEIIQAEKVDMGGHTLESLAERVLAIENFMMLQFGFGSGAFEDRRTGEKLYVLLNEDTVAEVADKKPEWADDKHRKREQK